MPKTINRAEIIEMINRLYRGVSPREEGEIIDSICEEFRGWIFRLVSVSVGNLADAEDVLQDILIDLVSRIVKQQFDPLLSVNNYIRFIISKHIIKYLKDKANTKTSPSAALSFDTGEREISNSLNILLVSRIKSPHEDIFMNEKFIDFYGRLEHEKNPERLLAVLQTQYEIYELDGQNTVAMKNEIADQFGVSYGTIQNDIKRLAKIAAECGVFDEN